MTDDKPFVLRPTFSDPGELFSTDFDEDGQPVSGTMTIGWSFAWGARLSFGQEDGKLTLLLSISDDTQRNGVEKRSVAPEQLREYAAELTKLADLQDKEHPATGSTPPVDPDDDRVPGEEQTPMPIGPKVYFKPGPASAADELAASAWPSGEWAAMGATDGGIEYSARDGVPIIGPRTIVTGNLADGRLFMGEVAPPPMLRGGERNFVSAPGWLDTTPWDGPDPSLPVVSHPLMTPIHPHPAGSPCRCYVNPAVVAQQFPGTEAEFLGNRQPHEMGTAELRAATLDFLDPDGRRIPDAHALLRRWVELTDGPAPSFPPDPPSTPGEAS